MRLGHSVLLAGCALTASLSGCFPPDEGRNPPLDSLYFPVGVALDTTGDRLYVANSDFDLQFNAGTVQVFDLARLREFLPNFASGQEEPCGPLREKSDAERLLAPGRCGALDPNDPPRFPENSSNRDDPVLIDVVEIGAFATDVIYRADPNATVAGDAGAAPVSQPGRLFIPVRGDATMHWIDVEPGGDELDCGQGGRAFGGTCDDNHRRGDDPSQENTRDISLPSEPYGIDADARGGVIVVTHQSDGQLALFVNDWTSGPELKFVLGGLTSGAVAVASIPEPKIVDSSEKQAMQDAGVEPIPYQPSFLVAFRNSTEIRLVRFFADTPTDDPTGDGAEPERDFIEASQSTTITALSQGFESRGLAIDAAARQTCERGCADDPTCLGTCAGIPLGVYASNRRPSSLLLGETRPNNSATSSDDIPRFFDAVPVSPGAGRVVVGDVLGRDGNPVRRVFIVCFDARKLYIYDPVGARVEKVVQTGRGPHALAVHAHPSSIPEEDYALGYLAHFTDSYIGVIDLDQRNDTYGEIVLTLGHPSPPRASK